MNSLVIVDDDALPTLANWLTNRYSDPTLRSSHVCSALTYSKNLAAKAYESLADVNHHIDPKGTLIDHNV